ncbi:hypothetical protein CERSUDRAFT_72599 [Gelatoporia subvermispora B]|uniref:NACHT domain-containing protein n=1 Tax=Ceriporiopsis subvermispora (strain B) TaxID=914234 RepID=M2RGP8_CERS8|nr:hypothetical protein CERSUDRAFT_72599 [Gelatoporia subvermispora B]
MSQLELMFKDALGKYNQQTKKDLENEPFVADLKNCKTAGDVMKILREPANKLIDRQEKDKEKSGLMRLLDRIVDVLHALHLNETLGEGIGTVWGPGKAVIGAVVVLLETARNVREGYKMLMELLEDVSSFIVRLEVYSKNTISSEMREILVKLLGKVMSIVGLATEQIREGRWSKLPMSYSTAVAHRHPERYMKTLLGDSAVEDAFKKLNRLTSVETQMASTESLKLLHDLVSRLDLHMQGVQPPLTEIQKNLDSLNVSIGLTLDLADIKKDVSEMNRNDMVRDCREWLSSPDPSTNHNAALNSHHEGTAVWFIEGEMMQEWKIVGSLLWVCGKPGSGKTILCSAIIEALLCNCLMLNHVVVYFYCDFRDPAKQDIDGLLSRLLVDMSAESTECTKILWDFYSTHRNGSRRASNTELTQCFEKMLRASSHRSVYIVIDALDECPDSGNKPPRDRILTLIHDLLGLGLSNVHICVTSRPEAGIAEVLVHLQSQTIAIDGDVGQTDDIDSYVRSSVYGDIKFRSWSEELKALVFKVLSEKADGMFRWVSCQLETLRLCPPSRVKRTLETLPKTLDETYDRILDRIRGTEAEHDLLRIFQCLANSK